MNETRNAFFTKHRFFMNGFACHLEFESGIRLVYDEVEDILYLELNDVQSEFSSEDLDNFKQYKTDIIRAYNIMKKFKEER